VNGSELIADLQARDLVHDTTDLDALRTRLDEPITLYSGFDPTADSLHIGHLVPLLVLRRFQEAGHRPLALAGGATGMIGDPSGRSEERQLLDMDTLDRNLGGIKEQLARLLRFDGPAAAELVDNRDWTAPVSVLEFLRDVGRHVTVNQMLARESVKKRVASEHGISFTEFSYMLLQGNDFWWLSEHKGCDLQIGGADQWGNIVTGIELIRRRSGRSAHALTVPLVTRADGQKFGKSAEGAIWLSAERTSPYALYQYFVNVDDRDVRRFLLQMTLLPVAEIDAVAAEHAGAPEARSAQRRLAAEVTTLLHGAEAAAEAEAASRSFTTPSATMAAADFEVLAGEIPTTVVDRSEVAGGIDLVELLVRVGLESSKGAARRTIDQGGIYVNDVPAEPGSSVGPDQVLQGAYVLLRRGKQRRHLVQLSPA
jgi:tyrosyl-tRNA synthetase